MNPISAKVIERPAARFLSLDTLRKQCEIVPIDGDSDAESHPDDDLLLAYCDAATDHAEKFTGRSILVRNYEFALDDFPRRRPCPPSWQPWSQLQPAIEVPYPPLIQILSLTFTDDSDGELDEGTHYTVDTYGDKAKLHPVDTWPTVTPAAPNRVRCQFRAGYMSEEDPDTDAETAPGAIRAAVLIMVQDLHENRGQVTEDCLRAVEALLRPWRVLTGMA